MAMMSITDSEGLMHLVRNSKGRNRSVDEKSMAKDIDPDGIHVMNFHMIHNDVEYRTLWMVKLKDSMDPANVWIDCGFPVFDKNTELLQMSEIHGREQCFS